MIRSEKETVIGFLILGLLSAGLNERARISLRATGMQIAPGARVRTAASPSGWFGAVIGRASRADLYISDGKITSPALPDASRTSSLPVHVRRSLLDGRNIELLGISVRRVRALQSDVVVDGHRILAGRPVDLISGGHGVADIIVDAASVEDQVRRKLPQLRNISAVIDGGLLTVNAESTFPPGRLTASAGLEVRDETEVVLRQPRVWVGGRAFQGDLVEALLRTLNPVFSLESADGLTSRYAISNVQATEGVLKVGLVVRPRSIRKADAR